MYYIIDKYLKKYKNKNNEFIKSIVNSKLKKYEKVILLLSKINNYLDKLTSKSIIICNLKFFFKFKNLKDKLFLHYIKIYYDSLYNQKKVIKNNINKDTLFENSYYYGQIKIINETIQLISSFIKQHDLSINLYKK